MEWLIAIGVLLGLCCVCLLLALPLVNPRRVIPSRSPAEYNLPFSTISLVTSDNTTLKGWWIPAAGSSRTVIMLHGYAGSMDPDLKYSPHLHDAGFNVLMFDFRAHARSGGRICTVGARETRDVKAAVEASLAHGSRWIGLLGFSMGGRAALLAAPSLPRVNAIISDGAPPRLLTAVIQALIIRRIPTLPASLLTHLMLAGASFLAGVNLFKHDVLQGAHALQGIPVLLIHGEKDRFTKSREINLLLARAGDKAALWSVPEAKHRDVEDTRPEEYLNTIIGFFQQTT